MKIIKILLETILLTILTIAGFGGGCLYWLGFCFIFGIEGIIAEIGFYISALLLAIISWIVTPKIADKIL